ncbi:endospore germination permease [Paenibacillus sp. BSR1-1]|uniref:GerAB/ArcD/ProY family transporter n=1 Tax=Paenibacillus sp. BSR1-1 TaxID=3020845 RepID=UPI0025AF6AD0|nr:endospore germination permease [Paenibacillus sp. BSR1-1]MDN3019656.1 endospore germination permease [Paenibacillus sp. BSR1-1]
MLKTVKISARQFAILVILFSVGTTILVIPGILAQEVKQDAWMAAVIGTVIGLLIVTLYIAIVRKFPMMTLVEIIETLLGKWLGKAVSLSFVFYSFIGASELLYYVGSFLTTQLIKETPPAAIHIIFAGILVMGVRLGLETIARSAELLFPIFILLFLLIMFSVIVTPELWKIDNLQPILNTGIKPMTRAVILFSSVFSLPLNIFLMIFPISVTKPKEAEKNFFSAIFIGGVCLFILISLTILVLGPETSSRQLYPSYTLARRLKVGDFLQRVEAILAIMWEITIFFKMTIYFYASITGLVQTLNIKDYRPLVIPLGMIMVTTSLVSHPNVIHSAKFDYEIWPVYALTYGLVLPLLLLVVYAIRKLINLDKKLFVKKE